MPRFLVSLFLIAGLLPATPAPPAPLAAQQADPEEPAPAELDGSSVPVEGTVTGTVTDAGTGQPISAVQLSVVGTGLGGLTNEDGRYLIQNVPDGPQTLRAERRRPQGQNAWADNDCTGFLPSGYVPASRARWVADNLVTLLDGWSDAEVTMRNQRLARASQLAGFSLSMLGAAHCSIALDSGPEISSMQAFAEAEERFSNALQYAQSSGATDIANAARLGRARVRLYQGDTQGALADAREVPEGFRMDLHPSDAPNRLNNRIWATNLFNFSFGVAPWTRELMTGGVPDPRTTTYDTGQNTGWAPGNVWGQSKYTSASPPMPIARWEEAQFIIAEVVGGDEAVRIIDALRDRHGLPRFMGMGDSEIRQAVIDERQRELWFEGFRAYDIHRLNLPLVPAPGEPYQLGVKGGSYGDQTCIPIPIIETFNNPTIRGGA